MRLRMIDRSEYTIASVAAFSGLCAQQMMAVWSTLPWAVQTFLQGLITIVLGACTLVVGHFLRRYLNRRWPVGAIPQAEAIRHARFNLSAFVWSRISRLRKVMSRRKGS